ncbi:septal ring factor EnvC (AmiA/AmiB activator) [Allocatelliglobosispora scoriae]|uniref:Septal ring factor EnvC (AmiA/AmiB activator) n=1 Tax=Allocatelliglobosispora scoriae TaxID=643052 RepID=A0A841BYZ6_9ACTN|nr:hypothetical protein [Allocatelliglobosispora scoriae]MBB5872806.1 septal ring factor EnvC (AmiA/AmiB activator) [Allocatelliglobosispora scoriae]
MPATASPRRIAASLLAVIVAASLLVAGGPPAPALAEPGDEGHNQQLIQNLEAAARGYIDAKTALDVSTKRQAELRIQLAAVEKELGPLRAKVGDFAAASYQSGRLSGFGALLASANPDQFLDRAAMLQEITYQQDQAIGRLTAAEERVKSDKAAVDAEAAKQAKLSADMKARMKVAETAIIKAGGGSATGYLDPDSPAAIPAPRDKNGNWPTERCSVDDPTKTGGCITPRLLHAYNEARKNGYTRFTKCWRTQSWGEHPRGRACDFSSAKGGFAGTATGGDLTYGNKLAAFFIRNASSLGVLYVIWFRKIWFPGLGWRSYSGCCDPSASHTNHVHLSMY